jgi:hypothetical protein
MTILKLLAVCGLLALAGCDTTSWGATQATGGGTMSVPCASLSNNPPNTEGMNQSQRDAAEAAPAAMC